MPDFEASNHIAPSGHPLHTLMEEHRLLLSFAARLVSTVKALKPAGSFPAAQMQMREINEIVDNFKESQNHYLREENVIFPFVEKHGLTGPPSVMWAEHDQIRSLEKMLFQLVSDSRSVPFQDFVNSLERLAMQQAQLLQNHFFKENNILFPHALELLTAAEWEEAKREFSRIGYCPFTPEADRLGAQEAAPAGKASIDELIKFSTGSLSKEVLEAIFSTLPVELTFVDQDDTFRFFSHTQGTIFTRSTATLGTRVQNCHPQKSLHLVNKILEEFKNGTRNVAEFCINFKGRLVYIRYFAVRNPQGQYLGSLEVTQDITEVKKVEGEKRLL